MADGIRPTNRSLLEQLHRSFDSPFRAADAAQALGLELPRARRILAYLAKRGWLSRIRHGLYTTVPLGATSPADWHEDPWAVANATFAPCYIGGWSACEYWDLTEQIFRGIVVFTGQTIRSITLDVQGTPFRLKHRDNPLDFGTRPAWRHRVRVAVSDPSQTIADILDTPSIGGGIRHIAGVLAEYFDSEHAAPDELTAAIERIGNRTAFKRLGYLLETMNISPDLMERCRSRISTGLSPLDPSVKHPGRISKRWNLQINVRLNSGPDAT